MIKFSDLGDIISRLFDPTEYEQDELGFSERVTLANSPNSYNNFFMVLNFDTERI